MDETARIWIEILFNCAYLVVIWGLAAAMLWGLRQSSRPGVRSKGSIAPPDLRAARLTAAAFALLALGDSGHVGFRVYGYLNGGLEQQISLFGRSFGLVGLGALATAITVTFFYMLVLELWRTRFRTGMGLVYFLLMAAGVVRLGLMIPAVNDWNALVPPQPWSLVRNLPLMLQGLGVAYLILDSARQKQDRTFSRIGWMILVSYACYIPVILFVQQAPLLGMLMIPKTLAYVAIGFLAYNGLFRGLSAPRPHHRRAHKAPAG